MSYYLSNEDRSSCFNKVFSVYQGLRRQSPNRIQIRVPYIIKTVLLDPKPKSWFLVNDSNDDLSNPNRKERTKDEEFSTKSVQAHETITKALSTLMNRSEMKRLMKERYIEKHNKDEDFDFSFSHFPSIDRASIRKIYASVAKEMGPKLKLTQFGTSTSQTRSSTHRLIRIKESILETNPFWMWFKMFRFPMVYGWSKKYISKEYRGWRLGVFRCLRCSD